MTTITPSITAAGGAAWPAGTVAGKFASTFGMMNAIATISNRPMASQLQEKMSKSARAQRRALIEPIPSQINATAKMTYTQIPGRIAENGIGGGPFGIEAASSCPITMKKVPKAAMHPSPIVKTPKIISPVERS